MRRGELTVRIIVRIFLETGKHKKERGEFRAESLLRYKMRKIRMIIGTVLCAMVLALGNRMPVMAEEVVSEELKAADTLNFNGIVSIRHQVRGRGDI